MRISDWSSDVCSSDLTTNLRLVGAMAATGKPLLLSTGMCELSDIAEAVRLCNGLGNDNLVLLQCGSLYPLPPEQANLRVLESFRSSFGTALELGRASCRERVCLYG